MVLYRSDDDECALAKCPFTSTCENTPGSFVCRCNNGFRHTSPTDCEGAWIQRIIVT